MADMIDAEQAKSLLQCDDATLSNYVNNGTIRAQRVSGQLMLNRDDVANLASGSASDSDDGTIVLSGDSEDLSIDLGEVIDSEAVTMVQPAANSQPASESITFGDELEVVNFDDGNTEDLTFDENAAEGTENLSFTDQNTAIITDVDQTAVGSATATSDFQTVEYDDDGYDDGGERSAGSSVRRSVRSQRVRRAAPKTHWIWPVLLGLTIVVLGFFVAPYVHLQIAQFDKEGETYRDNQGSMMAVTYRYHGIQDNFWTDFASSVVGFTIEPDRRLWEQRGVEGPYIPIDDIDPLQPLVFRYRQFLGQFADGRSDEDALRQRYRSWVITRIEDEPSADDPRIHIPRQAIATTQDGVELGTYNVRVVPDAVDGIERYEPEVTHR